MKQRPKSKHKIVRSKNRHIVVRSVRRGEPDYAKYVNALVARVIEQHRKINPDSVKWYDERYPYGSKNGEI